MSCVLFPAKVRVTATQSKTGLVGWIQFSYNARNTENVIALYAILSKDIEKFNIKGGVRFENNNLQGRGDDEKIENQYFEFFPSLSIKYNINKLWATSLAYSRKVKRPAFQNLLPNVTYIDSLSYFTGNPSLTPEYISSIDYSILYREQASINFSYLHITNPMHLYIEKDETNENITVATTKNLNLSEKYALSLNIPNKMGLWTTYNSFGISYEKIAFEDNSTQNLVKNNKPFMYAYSYNNFEIMKGLDVHFEYKYNSAGINGIFEFEDKHILSAGITQHLLEKRLKIQLTFNDIFQKDNINSYTNINGMSIKYQAFYDASFIRLAIRYNIGTKVQTKRYKTDLSNELDRIKEE